MNTLFVQITAEIVWILDEYREKFQPGKAFKSYAKFTSNFSSSFTAVVSYYGTIDGQLQFHKVRLSFPFAMDEEIKNLSRNTEILLLDAYKVYAICRNVVFVENQRSIAIGDP